MSFKIFEWEDAKAARPHSAQRLLPYVFKCHPHIAASLTSLPDGLFVGTRVIPPEAVVEGLLCVQAGNGATGSAMKVIHPFYPHSMHGSAIM